MAGEELVPVGHEVPGLYGTHERSCDCLACDSCWGGWLQSGSADLGRWCRMNVTLGDPGDLATEVALLILVCVYAKPTVDRRSIILVVAHRNSRKSNCPRDT